MPENQSKEKMDTLRALGAELVLVPPTKFSNPGHFVHTSRRLAEETEGAVWANQFDNIANRKAHIESTAPEIWEQMDGRIDGFTCSVGTGGTLAGVGMGLKEFDEKVTIALTDPHGAALYNYYACGELSAEGNSVAEGIGQGRITANLEGAPIDTQFRISDEEGLDWVARLLQGGRAVPRPVVGHQRRRRGGAGQAARRRASASRRSCATPASAISRRSTTASGSRRRACRYSTGCVNRERARFAAWPSIRPISSVPRRPSRSCRARRSPAPRSQSIQRLQVGLFGLGGDGPAGGARQHHHATTPSRTRRRSCPRPRRPWPREQRPERPAIRWPTPGSCPTCRPSRRPTAMRPPPQP